MKIDLDNASQEELELLHSFAPHYVDIIEPKEKKAEKVDKKEDKQDESK
jgi:hypothetical protein